jgi:hypothetical protein
MKYTLIILLLLSSFFPLSAFAQEQASEAAKQVDYTLPYPGLLPDHPFYFLKNVRDTIVQLLIADPVKKAEFYQLQADKSFATGMTLLQKKKDTMAFASLKQSHQYATEVLSSIHNAEKQGYETGALVGTLSTALKKYDATFHAAQQDLTDENKKTIDALRRTLASLHITVQQEMLKK